MGGAAENGDLPACHDLQLGKKSNDPSLLYHSTLRSTVSGCRTEPAATLAKVPAPSDSGRHCRKLGKLDIVDGRLVDFLQCVG